MLTQAQYYAILGLMPGASKESVKKAYREMAKRYHPDVNKSEHAHEQFLMISEAYEMLSNPPIWKAAISDADAQRKRARERAAAAAARMQYEAFLQSDYYRFTSSVSNLLDFIVVGSIMIGVGYGIIQLVYHDYVIAACIVLAISIGVGGMVYHHVMKPRQIHLSDYIDALASLIRFHSVQLFLILMFSVYTFVSVGMLTLIPTDMLGCIYLTVALGLYFFYRLKPERTRIRLCIFVYLVLNLLLVLNFTISSNPRSFYFRVLNNPSLGEYTVHFANGELDAYTGARFFFDQRQLENHRGAWYTFEEGLLGIPVITERKLLK